MSAVTYESASTARAEAAVQAAPAARRPGLFARMFAAMVEARQRKALEEIRRYSALMPTELERAGLKINERSEDSLPFIR